MPLRKLCLLADHPVELPHHHQVRVRAEKPHPESIERLRSPKRAHTVAVATPCWPALAEPPGEQCLRDGVVDLVGAGVVQVLPLEVDQRAAGAPRSRAGLI
jgi:hypothetical protein